MRLYFQLLRVAFSPTEFHAVRTRYVDARMRRDAKRRAIVKDYAPLRLRVNAMRKNNILPQEIQVWVLIYSV